MAIILISTLPKVGDPQHRASPLFQKVERGHFPQPIYGSAPVAVGTGGYKWIHATQDGVK